MIKNKYPQLCMIVICRFFVHSTQHFLIKISNQYRVIFKELTAAFSVPLLTLVTEEPHYSAGYLLFPKLTTSASSDRVIRLFPRYSSCLLTQNIMFTLLDRSHQHSPALQSTCNSQLRDVKNFSFVDT